MTGISMQAEIFWSMGSWHRPVEEVSDLFGRKLELATPNEAGKLVREDEKPLPFRYGEMSHLPLPLLEPCKDLLEKIAMLVLSGLDSRDFSLESGDLSLEFGNIILGGHGLLDDANLTLDGVEALPDVSHIQLELKFQLLQADAVKSSQFEEGFLTLGNSVAVLL
jgi:hypothetical protein